MDDEAAPPQRDGATQNENQAEENALSLDAMEALALPSDYAAPPSNHSPTTSSGIQWMIAEQAHQLLVNKQYSQAISTASAGLVQSNENTAPLSMLHYVTGRASRAMGLDEAARSAFQRAIELNNAR